LPVSAERTFIKGEPYKPQRLVADSIFRTAEEISAAVMEEARLANAAGYTDADVVACLKEMLVAITDRDLVTTYRGSRYIPDANRLGVTAPDSASVGRELMEAGVLRLIKSRLNPQHISFAESTSSFSVKYGEECTEMESHIVMSFIGAGKLTQNPLIKQAVDDGIIVLAQDPASKAEVVAVKHTRETSAGVFCLGAMAFSCMEEGVMKHRAGAPTCIEHGQAAAAFIAPQIIEIAKITIRNLRRGDRWPQTPRAACSGGEVAPTSAADMHTHTLRRNSQGDGPASGGKKFTGVR